MVPRPTTPGSSPLLLSWSWSREPRNSRYGETPIDLGCSGGPGVRRQESLLLRALPTPVDSTHRCELLLRLSIRGAPPLDSARRVPHHAGLALGSCGKDRLLQSNSPLAHNFCADSAKSFPHSPTNGFEHTSASMGVIKPHLSMLGLRQW